MQTPAARQSRRSPPQFYLPVGGLHIYSQPGGGITGPGGGATVVATVQNDMLLALNKIVYNSYVIAANTGLTAYKLNGAPNNSAVYAQGGWIAGGIPGIDSVPIMAMPGEYVINQRAASALAPYLDSHLNRGVLPPPAINDNSSAAETRALRAEVRELKTELKSVLRQVGQQIVSAEIAGAEHIGERLDRGNAIADEGVKAHKRRTLLSQ